MRRITRMPTSVRPTPRGFTLIELMVVLVIVGILAAVAYPVYTSHLQRSRRADAVKLLTAVVQAQERYRGNRTAYATTLSDLGIDASRISKHYTLDIAALGESASLVGGYLVTATVRSDSQQANDSQCAKLRVRVDTASVRYESLSSANADTSSLCWPK